MRRLLLLAVALAGCEDGRDGDLLQDARPPPDAPLCGVTCDPLAPVYQQGCYVGQKCTWLEPAASSSGEVACVPDGTVALGAPCSHDGTAGYDDCQAGLYCVDGTCRDLCGFDGSPNAACPTSSTCDRFEAAFSICDATPFAGTCAPT